MQDKIIVLITYFGDLPWYFSYYVNSCKYNTTIDFLIFSDREIHIELPVNIKVVYKTLKDIKALISKKMDFEVSLDVAYKLCDFKPAYGLIFEDYTRGYDFWAQSDIDIIYGDLRHFFNSKILANYKFVNVRHDYTTGCFTLSSNSDEMKNMFKKSNDYKMVFSNSAHMGFEELNFKHCEISEGKALDSIKTDIVCFTHIIKEAQMNNEIKAYFDFILIEGLPGKLKFCNGKLIYNNKFEAVMYHLFWLKKIYKPKKLKEEIPNIFFISPSRIYFKQAKSSLI